MVKLDYKVEHSHYSRWLAVLAKMSIRSEQVHVPPQSKPQSMGAVDPP